MIPMGVGEAFTARYYTSCLALGFRGEWLMIDCPHPAERCCGRDQSQPVYPNRLTLSTCTQLQSATCMRTIVAGWRHLATIRFSR